MAAITRKEIDSLLGLLEQQLGKSFTDAVARIKSTAQIDKLVQAIEAGDLNKVMQAAGMRAGSWSSLTEQVRNAYMQGGAFAVAKTIPKGFGAVFDIDNRRAQKWLREKSSYLITRINKDQQRTIQIMLQEGMRMGSNPRSVALDLVGRVGSVAQGEAQKRIGGVIGLNGPQAQAVLKAEAELATLDPNYFNRKLRDRRFDSIVRKAIDTNTPLKADTITKLSSRYSDKLLKLRGDTIGRTEALASLNASAHESLLQVVDSGLAPSKAIKRVWRHSYSAGERPGHLQMGQQQQTVGLDEMFVNPETGAQLPYPGVGAAEEVINCRCYVEPIVDFVKVEQMGAAPLPGTGAVAPKPPTIGKPKLTDEEKHKARLEKEKAARAAKAAAKAAAQAALKAQKRVPQSLNQAGVNGDPQSALNKLKTLNDKTLTAQVEKFEEFVSKHNVGAIFLNADSALGKQAFSASDIAAFWKYAKKQGLGTRFPGKWKRLEPEAVNGYTASPWNHVVAYIRRQGGTLDQFDPAEMVKYVRRQAVKGSQSKIGFQPPFTFNDGMNWAVSQDAHDFVVYLHEMGHQVHFKALYNAWDMKTTQAAYKSAGQTTKALGDQLFDKFMNNRGSSMSPTNAPLTHYGAQDEYEFAAEHFVMWVLDYEELKRLRPDIAKYIDLMMKIAMD